MMMNEEILGDARTLAGTPQEDLVFIPRRRANALFLPETSDLGNFESEEDWSTRNSANFPTFYHVTV
jgi:hypothetical protein